MGRYLRAAGLVEFIWLAGARGWAGTREALQEGTWSLFQKDLEQTSPVGGFDYDGNVVNPAHASFGQFDDAAPQPTARGVGTAALYRVAARSGLRLRGGPSDDFDVIDTLPAGRVVQALRRDGDWLAVDLEGDGARDGYMFAGFLEPVSGGLPLELGSDRRPIDVARAEMATGVSEVPGPQHNPRIVMYHATTEGGPAADETAWCSSFVNYCVEQAGLAGTDSKWARSWHDLGWGRDVTAAPLEGDVVVWRRRGDGDDGGHVGFYLDGDDASVRVLGGNQGNRVSIAIYPRHGMLGPYQYDLLSIRR